MSLTTVSPSLAGRLYVMCLARGIAVTLRVERPSYQSGESCAFHLHFIRDSRSWERFDTGSAYLVPIKRIEHVSIPPSHRRNTYLYDFQVEGDHHDFVASTVIHNCIIQHRHPRLVIYFEDSQQDRSNALLAVDERLKALHDLPSCIFDCDIGVVEHGKRWPRPRLMTLTADRPELPADAHIAITAFDVLYWDGASVNERPFRERRALLEKIAPTLREHGIQIPPEMPIRTKDDLVRAWHSERFGLADRSEGVVLKAQDWVYEPEPATDGMAKIKHALEVKAIVLDVKRTKDGGYNFRGGLLPGTMIDKLSNVVEFKGQKYVDLGFSFNGTFPAQVGDIITAEVEEITWDQADRRLNWLGAKPLDVDRERSEPYAAAQVIDLARRARVLQEVPDAPVAAALAGAAAEPDDVADPTDAPDAPDALTAHLHVEVAGSPELLNDVSALQAICDELIQSESVIAETWYTFEPQGVTGVLLLATSHLAIHTWPEHGRAVVDIESCAPDADPDRWRAVLAEHFDSVVEKRQAARSGPNDQSEHDEQQGKPKPFFQVVGSLQPYIDLMLRFIPPNTQRIVEAFCGCGELVWHVEPPEGHVLADLDPDIVQLHQICRDLAEDDYARLRTFKWVGDEAYYRKLWHQPPPRDKLEWFHRELYLRRFARYGRERSSFQPKAVGVEYRWEPRVRAAQRRLRNQVVIERADFRTTLKKYDRSRTFFFLDPPWPARAGGYNQRSASSYYRLDVPPIDDLAKAIAGVQHGTVMLVIEGKGDQLKPLRDAGLHETRFAWYHPWSRANRTNRIKVQEKTYVSIFTNYRPPVAKTAQIVVAGSWLPVLREPDRTDRLEQVSKVRQPLGSPGGKTRMASKLAKLIPPHRTYVEPYAGGAALFWKKEPSDREVLNDIDAEIMSVYQFLQKASDAELAAFSRKDWVGRERLFDTLAESKPRTLMDRAYRAWYLSRFGYCKTHSTKGKFLHTHAGQRADVNVDRLRQLRERLRGVTLMVGDALDAIRNYDAPDTFFYVDPPYLDTDSEFRHGPDVEHIKALGRALRGIKGKALVSGNRATLDALDLPASWQVRRIATTYSMDWTNPAGELRYEYIAANYRIEKAAARESEDGETRGEAALRNWEAHWHEAMPTSGKALPFILHAHWRGLTEDETRLDMAELLKTNNSLHFDLRLGTDRFNGWWGISLFAGSTTENRDELRIFRMMHDPEERLESAPKQFGPAAWLQVGVRAPLVVEPGGVGSTGRAWSKFFAIDRGTWRLGMARVHGVELWLDGQRLKGRFLWQYAPLEPGQPRQWLLTRPEDQRPYAETHDLGDVIRELAEKGQRWLFWPKDPNDLSKGLQQIDVQQAARRLRKYYVLKRQEEQRYTLGVAYPADRVDAHGDYTTPEELERAAWEFLRRVQTGRASVGLMHRTGTDGAGTVVESYIYRGPDWQVGDQVVRAGDWLLGVIWDESAWELIKRGEITGYSIQGMARKT